MTTTTTIWTIGHSTHSFQEFVAILKSFGIEALVDVRTVPRSRHNPQFNKDELERTLPEVGIEYAHTKDLGGLRHPVKDSINTAWRNDSFRGYADYMQTPAFDQALTRLVDYASTKRTAIVCAEAVPWRCHRSLIADALLARGIQAIEIMGESKSHPHKLTPFASVQGSQVQYPGNAEQGTKAENEKE